VSAANAMSQLESLLLQALSQQAYFHKDPDGIFTNSDDQAIITKGASDLIPSWNVNLERVNDIIAVIQGTKTTDEIITKYSIDLNEYRKELE
jgi:hypothetical protein